VGGALLRRPVFDGTPTASSDRVKLYDLMAEGYHTPLSAPQIADLFRAGRLLRNDPCKEIGKTAWRTIDELFPLLKYDSSVSFSSGRTEGTNIYRSIAGGVDVTRRTVLIGTLVALFVLCAFVVGPGYFGTGDEWRASSISRRTHIRSPANPDSNQSASSGVVTATTHSSGSYSNEQMYRAAPSRQEDRARQLEETRLGEQRIIDERDRAQQERQTQSRRTAEQEFTLPLGTYTRVSLGGASYRIAVHDEGPDEIRVLVDYRPVLRFQKHSGFDGRDIETLILSNGSAHLYYVNEISDHVGHCKLRLRDE
jgi:hypothetical protein